MELNKLFSVINYANLEHVVLDGRPVIGGNTSNLQELIKQHPEFLSDGVTITSSIQDYNPKVFSISDIRALTKALNQGLKSLPTDIIYEDYITDSFLIEYLNENCESISV